VEQAPSTVIAIGVEASRPQSVTSSTSVGSAPTQAETAPTGSSANALLVAQLATATQAGPAAPAGAVQPLAASMQTTPMLAAPGGKISPASTGVVFAGPASRSALDGSSPDTEGYGSITRPASPTATATNRDEMNEAALAVFVQFGQQSDGNLALAGRDQVAVEDALGSGEESGGLVWSGLAGAGPVLLALLPARWSAADRESRASKRQQRQQG
jgi:hypothetical protein